MNAFPLTRPFVVVMTILSLVASSAPLVAAPPGVLGVDTVLGPQGLLSGRVVDSAGRPVAAARVTLLREGRGLAVATCDDGGRFSVSGLAGGVYQVVAAENMTLVRAWTPAAAPPAAMTEVLLTSDSTVIRGQREASPLVSGLFGCRNWCNGFNDPLVLAGVVGLAVGIPVIVHNSSSGS